MVDGHPLLRATLRSGNDTYEAHLLLYLSLAGDLVLHPMAAGALAPTVDLLSGGVHLLGLEVDNDLLRSAAGLRVPCRRQQP